MRIPLGAALNLRVTRHFSFTKVLSHMKPQESLVFITTLRNVPSTFLENFLSITTPHAHIYHCPRISCHHYYRTISHLSSFFLLVCQTRRTSYLLPHPALTILHLLAPKETLFYACTLAVRNELVVGPTIGVSSPLPCVGSKLIHFPVSNDSLSVHLSQESVFASPFLKNHRTQPHTPSVFDCKVFGSGRFYDMVTPCACIIAVV